LPSTVEPADQHTTVKLPWLPFSHADTNHAYTQHNGGLGSVTQTQMPALREIGIRPSLTPPITNACASVPGFQRDVITGSCETPAIALASDRDHTAAKSKRRDQDASTGSCLSPAQHPRPDVRVRSCSTNKSQVEESGKKRKR
jgi:hypothetical protein